MSLKRLTLIDCGIGNRALKEIAKGVKEAICLQYVDLRHNNFETEGLRALIDALKSTMACKVLQIEGYYFKMEEAEMIASFLNEPNCVIEELDLHQAELEYDVFNLLAGALKTCNQLKAISFNKNNFGIEDYVDESDADYWMDGDEDQDENRLVQKNRKFVETE